MKQLDKKEKDKKDDDEGENWLIFGRVFCFTIHQEPFYFWRVRAGAAEYRAAPKLWILVVFKKSSKKTPLLKKEKRKYVLRNFLEV